MGQTLNNLTIIKSITIILVNVSRLKKNLFCFSLLSHTHTHSNYLIQRQHFTLFSLAIFSKTATICALLLGYLSEGGNSLLLSFLLRSSQVKISFLSLGFTLYFPSPHKEDPWAKAIKFFVVLSIYKTSFPIPS